MEEPITLCCGHSVEDPSEAIHIAYISEMPQLLCEDGEFSGLYCRECAEEYKRNKGAWELPLEDWHRGNYTFRFLKEG